MGAGTEMTIDELARQTGMTVRNIRAHQSRGLLPAPEVRGRTGYYGAEHVARIELIQELQGEGLNLEAIRRLLSGNGATGSEVLDFARALRTPFVEQDPEAILDRAGRELAALGIDNRTALATLKKIRRHAEGVSGVFVDLFIKEVWEPFDRAGRPEEDWPKVREALERLRPLASDVLLAVFQTTIREQTERTLKEVEPRPKRPSRERSRQRR